MITIKPIKAKNILKALRFPYIYIAKDHDGAVFAFTNKPKLVEDPYGYYWDIDGPSDKYIEIKGIEIDFGTTDVEEAILSREIKKKGKYDERN